MIRKLALTILATTLVLFQLNARPVHNQPIVLHQPDGTKIQAILNGDEFYSTIKDLHGHRLIKDSDGVYCYASFAPDGSAYSSGYAAGEEAPAYVLSASLSTPLLRITGTDKRALRDAQIEKDGSILKKIRNNAPATKSGTSVSKHCMILLVQFKDKKMTYTRQNFVDMIKTSGYSTGGANGSVNDYFNDQFKGDFTFNYEISDIITLDKNCSYYFGNDGDDKDVNAAEAVYEACNKAAAAGIDFSECDDDGDGKVDNVFLFVAGKDEADDGGEDCVWSHMYYLQYTKFKGLTLNGKVIDNYAISTELTVGADSDFTFTSIGTFCHEYSHALGLHDLYDTDYEGSGGTANGLWYTTGLMDGGNSNNYFNTPPHYNAIDYEITGIGNPETLKVGTYTLEPISKNRRYLKMETGNSGEYYLIECRSASDKWDKYIGGSGLLIYHIDRSNNYSGYSDGQGSNLTASLRWICNEINCRPDHECAELISATPGISAYTSDGYLSRNVSSVFYPSSSNDAYTPLTDPAFIFWDKSESPLAITNIKRSGENVTFTVTRMAEVVVPNVVLGETEIFQDAAIIQWSADDSEYTGNAFVSWGKSSGTQSEVEVEPYEQGKYSITLDALEQSTAYKASIYFRERSITSSEVPVNFTTKRIYDGYPFIFLNYVSRNEDGSFPKGTMIPLRIYNATDTDSIEWYMGNVRISTGGNGYYEVTTSGKLKAVITYSDGRKDVLVKEIKVK